MTKIKLPLQARPNRDEQGKPVPDSWKLVDAEGTPVLPDEDFGDSEEALMAGDLLIKRMSRPKKSEKSDA